MARFNNSQLIILMVVMISVLVTTILMNCKHEVVDNTGSSNAISIDNGDTKINWERYSTTDVVLDGSYGIVKSGVYHLTGEITDGLITIKPGVDGVVKLILDNVTVSNSNGPAIACYEGDDLVIELVGKNVLSDGSNYASTFDEDVTGALYSKADLTLQGDGMLSLNANYQDGIVGKDDLKFNGGNYDIVAVDDAVRGKDSVYVVDGDFTIKAGADGIKSTNATDAGKGFVLVEHGKMNLSVGDDGIHADREVRINGGEIAIVKSYEGIEAQVVTINDGNISVTAFDDGLNAGGGADDSATNRVGANPFDADEKCVLSVNGGNIYVNAAGDGIDSNGWLYFNGGEVVVDGPTDNGNGALDASMGVVMNGGSVLAVGASGMATALGDTSAINNVSIYLSSMQAPDTEILITDTEGNTVMRRTAAKSFSHIAAGSNEFRLGNKYILYLNGEQSDEITITGITTVVGNNTNQNTMPGPRRQR